MRVLVLRSVDGLGGGAEAIILRTAANLDPKRVRMTVCCIHRHDDALYDFDRRAAELGIDYCGVTQQSILARGVFAAVQEIAARRRVQIVDAQDYKAAFFASLLSKVSRSWEPCGTACPPPECGLPHEEISLRRRASSGTPTARQGRIIPAATLHGWSGQHWRERLVYYPAERLLVRRFPLAIAVSGPIRNTLVRWGCRPERIRVLPNGIDPAAFHRQGDARRRVRNSLGIAETDFVVGAVGRIEQEKRFDVLLRAMAILLPRRRELRLVIVGEGSLKPRLLDQMRRLGIADRCHLVGHRHDVVDLYQAFDVFVQSSDREGSPTVVVEAMAMEVPVVATEVGGTRELVQHEVHGLLVPRRSPPALADAIEQTLQVPDATAQRVAAARARVVNELSFDARTRRLEQMYLDLMEKRCYPATQPRGIRPVRVCFVIDRLQVAGTETQLLRLITGLDRSRVAPYLCLLDGEDETSRSLEPEDCPVLRLGVRRLRSPSTLRQAWRFARFLRRERIDVVQMHFPDSHYFAAPVARIAGVPHILRTRRDLGFWMKSADRWLAPLYNRIVTATIANCEACRRAVIEQERAAPDSIAVLENGIELDRLMSLPSPSTAASGKRPVVGLVANLRPVKGPDVFLRAAAMIASKHPHTRFRIAGSGDKESARHLIRQLRLENRVELVGSVRDVPALLGELDVAVLTSHSEGLSNAMIEYMAAARPIVATAVGGNVELIEHGVHGLLVPPRNPEAVAEAVGRLLADRAFASTLGSAARQRAGERYSSAAMLRRHEDFYTSLVD